MIIIGIIVSILVFTIIILIHELGHFGASRIFGVKVEEFGLGIPPRAKKLFKDKKGTLYSLNYLPLGGFVRLKGENPHILKDKNDKEALINKPVRQQSVIILAGVVMNFLLASLIFAILFFVGIKPVGINNQIETEREIKLIPTYSQAIESGLLIKNEGIILSPIDGSIAEQFGIEVGDILTEINGTKINDVQQIIDIVGNNAGSEIELILENSKLITLKVPEEGKIGVYLSDNIEFNQDFEYNYGVFSSIKFGFIETYNQSLLTLKGLKLLIGKIFLPDTPEQRTQALSQVSGPIGIVDFMSTSVTQGFTFILIIGAIISINLGVFNLLPIPALDGGRFLIIMINHTTKLILGKKSINETVESIIHLSFFVILIALSVIIAYNDINKIINN